MRKQHSSGRLLSYVNYLTQKIQLEVPGRLSFIALEMISPPRTDSVSIANIHLQFALIISSQKDAAKLILDAALFDEHLGTSQLTSSKHALLLKTSSKRYAATYLRRYDPCLCAASVLKRQPRRYTTIYRPIWFSNSGNASGMDGQV